MLPGTAKRHHPASCAWHPTVGSGRPCPGQKGRPLSSDLFSVPIICIHVLNGLLCGASRLHRYKLPAGQAQPVGFARPISTAAASMTEASPPRGSPPRMRSEAGMIPPDDRWGLESLTAPRGLPPPTDRAQEERSRQEGPKSNCSSSPLLKAHTHTHTGTQTFPWPGTLPWGEATSPCPQPRLGSSGWSPVQSPPLAPR